MVGKIYISGLIGTYGEERGIELIDVITQVKKQPTATSFEVYINSEGGVVDTGFDIYNYLKSLGLPITTIGSGMVASIATVIFMSGNKRIVKPNTEFMIHLPMGGIEYATADEMEAHAKGTREVENKIVQFYSKELGLGKEAITPLLKNETWLNSNQLNDLGFLTSESEIKIEARAIIKNKSKINKMSKKNVLTAILAKMLGTTVNKMIFSADDKEISFADIPEDGVIEVGARATIDGSPIGGTEEEPVEIVGADTKTYVFVDSVVTEIREVEEEMEEEEVTEDEMFDALVATLELVTEIEERQTVLETETVAIKKQRDEFKVKLDTALSTIAKLKGVSETPKEDKKEKVDNKKETAKSITAQWKERRINKQLKEN